MTTVAQLSNVDRSTAHQRSVRSLVGTMRAEFDRLWPVSPNGPSSLHEACRHALLPSRRQVCPYLLFESANAAGADWALTGGAVAATESLAAAARVLADLVNPGAPSSVSGRHGTTGALLASGALLFSAFDGLAERAELPPETVVAVTRALARAGLDSCRAHAEEVELRGSLDCDPERYLGVARRKTGSLFRAVCEAGAIIGTADTATVRTLTRYADHLGLAFQLHDDLAPYRHDTVHAAANDFTNRRPTFPLLCAYRVAGDTDRRRLESTLSGQLPAGYARQLAVAIATEAGAVELTQERIRREVGEARKTLDALPANPGVVNLGALAGHCLAE